MPDYDNTNSGALFKNDKKKTSSHPDYTGQLDVEGTEYWLSAWINKSAAGKTYMKIKINEKDPHARAKHADNADKLDDNFDDIPF